MPSIGVRTSGTSSFTQAGVILGVRGLPGFTSGLSKAGAATQLFGRNVGKASNLSGSQRALLKAQNAFIGLGNAIVKAGAIAAVAGVAIAGGIGVAAIKTATDVQQLTFALQGLVAIEIGKESRAISGVADMSDAMEKAAPVAIELRDRLRDVALESPIQYEQVFAALRLQLAYGATAQATTEFSAALQRFGVDMDKATHPALAMAEAVSQVGAVLARDSATFERLNYNLAQAILKGDLTAKNMRELRNAGLSLEDVFKSELNMTLEETREALKSGELATEDLQAAFIAFANRYFAPAAERMTQSLQGVINNFKDLWAFAATDLMTPMIEEITIKLNEWFDAGEKLLQQGVFKEMGEQLGEATRNVIAFFEGITDADIALAKFLVQIVAIGATFVVVASNMIKVANALAALKAIFGVAGAAGVASGTAVSAAWLGPAIAIAAIIALGAVLVKTFQLAIEHEKRVSAEAALAADSWEEYNEKVKNSVFWTNRMTEATYNLIKARQAAGKVDSEQELADAITTMNRYHDTVYVGIRNSHLYADAQGSLNSRIEYVNQIAADAASEMSELELAMAGNEAAAREAGEAIGLTGFWLEVYVDAMTDAANTETAERSQKALADAIGEVEKATKDSIPGYLAQQQAMEGTVKKGGQIIASMEEQEATMKKLGEALEEIADMYESWGNELSDAIGSIREAEQSAADAHQDYADEIKDINSDLADDLAKISEKYDDSLPDPTSVEERTGQLVDVWDEWALRMAAIQEVGGPGEDLEAEGAWLGEITAMLDGTEFAMRDGVENAQGWMMRLREAFYEGKLPPEFYNTDSALYQDWVAKKNAAQAEETRVANEEAAKRRAIAEAEREAALAEAEEERQDAIIMGALSLAESSQALQGWSQVHMGAMATAYDSATEVFEALKNGTLELTPELQALITNYAGGLTAVSGTAKGEAEVTQAALADVVAEAEELGSQIPTLKAEYAELENLLNQEGGQGPGSRAGLSPILTDEDVLEIQGRMQEIQTILGGAGLEEGAQFSTVAEDFAVATENIMGTLSSELQTLGEENAAVAELMIESAGGVAEAWYEAMIGNSVISDTEEATEGSKSAWDDMITHMNDTISTFLTNMTSNWKTSVKTLVTEINRISDAVTNLKDRINEIPTEVTVTITIKTETSPAAPMAVGIAKVEELTAALNAIPTDLGVTVSLDLPAARAAGNRFGSQLIAGISALSGGGKGTHGRWWDFTLNLFEPGKRLAGLADKFASRYTDIELPAMQDRMSEIDKLIKTGNITEQERNRLMDERLRLQDAMVENEETMLGLEKARADIDFLRQQVDLLELIRNHKLNAQQILGDITLGIDASASELMTVTTRALQAVVEQINNQLQIASPSKVMMQIGEFMMLGMGQGIMEAAHIPVEATTAAVIAPVVAAGAGGNTVNLEMNPTINTGMDQVVFENRVLDIIRRGVRGY